MGISVKNSVVFKENFNPCILLISACALPVFSKALANSFSALRSLATVSLSAFVPVNAFINDLILS